MLDLELLEDETANDREILWRVIAGEIYGC
jgi:hypothetical protein